MKEITATFILQIIILATALAINISTRPSYLNEPQASSNSNDASATTYSDEKEPSQASSAQDETPVNQKLNITSSTATEPDSFDLDPSIQNNSALGGRNDNPGPGEYEPPSSVGKG